jgi:uncharacterized RDD family membrane protein YckC
MFSNRIGFGPRLGATLLDILFTILLCTPILMFGAGAGIAAAMGLDAMFSPEDAEALAMIGLGAGMIGSILICALVGTVYTLIEAFTGASPGKRVMGLQVAKADGSAGEVSLYLLRWALKNSGSILNFILPAISSLASLVFFFGCFAALGEKRQALHDIIAKSAVYKKADIAA